MFHGVVVGLRDSDGKIVVLDWSTMQLKYFDSAGRHFKTAAGRGGGPGEIRVLGHVAIPDTDSSIAVVDHAQVVRYSWSGEYLGSIAVDYDAILDLIPADFHAALPVFPTSAGYWLQWSEANEWTQLSPTERQRRRAFFLYSPEFAGIDTLSIGPAELSVFIDRGWPWMPFSVGPQAAVGGNPSRIYVTNNESFEIRQFGPTGRLERIVRIAGSPEPVSPADINAWQESERASAERRGSPAEAEVRIREMPIPSTLPPFRELAVDRLGRVWAERYGHTGEPRRYLVVDTTGMVLGNVVLPERFRFFDVGADYLLGTWRDSLDVEFVRVYGY